MFHWDPYLVRLFVYWKNIETYIGLDKSELVKSFYVVQVQLRLRSYENKNLLSSKYINMPSIFSRSVPASNIIRKEDGTLKNGLAPTKILGV